MATNPKTKRPNKKKNETAISLHPLSLKEAMQGLLAVDTKEYEEHRRTEGKRKRSGRSITTFRLRKLDSLCDQEARR